MYARSYWTIRLICISHLSLAILFAAKRFIFEKDVNFSSISNREYARKPSVFTRWSKNFSISIASRKTNALSLGSSGPESPLTLLPSEVIGEVYSMNGPGIAISVSLQFYDHIRVLTFRVQSLWI